MKKAIPFILFSLLMLTNACSDTKYLYLAQQKVPKSDSLKSCACPTGFFQKPEHDGCERENKIPPLRQSDPQPIFIGDDTPGYYYMFGATIVTATGNTDWPFEAYLSNPDYTLPMIFDQHQNPLPFIRFNNRFLTSRVNYGSGRVTIRNGGKDNIWYTKTFCMEIPKNKKYIIHTGGDNWWKVKIDGREFAISTSERGFDAGVFLEQEFTSGKHLIEIKYLNIGSFGALWFEVFDNLQPQIQYASVEKDLNIIFSSKTLVGDYWDYTGEICPPGYAYDTCSLDKMCTKLESSPCM